MQGGLPSWQCRAPAFMLGLGRLAHPGGVSRQALQLDGALHAYRNPACFLLDAMCMFMSMCMVHPPPVIHSKRERYFDGADELREELKRS